MPLFLHYVKVLGLVVFLLWIHVVPEQELLQCFLRPAL